MSIYLTVALDLTNYLAIKKATIVAYSESSINDAPLCGSSLNKSL